MRKKINFFLIKYKTKKQKKSHSKFSNITSNLPNHKEYNPKPIAITFNLDHQNFEVPWIPQQPTIKTKQFSIKIIDSNRYNL